MKTYSQICVLTLVMSATIFISGCESFGQPIIDDDFFILPGEQTTNLSLDVRSALKNNGQTANLNISVTSLGDDSVKLSGFVPDDATLYEAERVASGVGGVRHVVNGLIVR